MFTLKSMGTNFNVPTDGSPRFHCECLTFLVTSIPSFWSLLCLTLFFLLPHCLSSLLYLPQKQPLCFSCICLAIYGIIWNTFPPTLSLRWPLLVFHYSKPIVMDTVVLYSKPLFKSYAHILQLLGILTADSSQLCPSLRIALATGNPIATELPTDKNRLMQKNKTHPPWLKYVQL